MLAGVLGIREERRVSYRNSAASDDQALCKPQSEESVDNAALASPRVRSRMALGGCPMMNLSATGAPAPGEAATLR
jgi:hypothetical protein